MPHEHRFHLPPDVLAEGAAMGAAVLEGPEAHHALHVLRARPGDTVRVFDGAGHVASATVTATTRREVTLAVGPVEAHAPPPQRLVLVQALLQREKSMDSLVARCTEVGVAEFRFFHAGNGERIRVKPDKWPRIALESCKQCGRLHLPAFTVHDTLAAALDGAPAPLLMAALEGPATPLRNAITGDAASLLIGPEGDFTAEEEARAMDRGAVRVSLGPYTLRAEVAAAVGSTLALYELGALGPAQAS